MEMVRVTFYGKCILTELNTVLSDLQYQYEGTECGPDMMAYDIYSNEDGDYYAVRTCQRWHDV